MCLKLREQAPPWGDRVTPDGAGSLLGGGLGWATWVGTAAPPTGSCMGGSKGVCLEPGPATDGQCLAPATRTAWQPHLQPVRGLAKSGTHSSPSPSLRGPAFRPAHLSWGPVGAIPGQLPRWEAGPPTRTPWHPEPHPCMSPALVYLGSVLGPPQTHHCPNTGLTPLPEGPSPTPESPSPPLPSCSLSAPVPPPACVPVRSPRASAAPVAALVGAGL